MNKDIKHYFVVGGILCAIGASSALLIGLTNVVTAPTIEKNDIKKEKQALKAIYDIEDEAFGEKVDLKSKDLPEKLLNFIDTNDSKHQLLSYWDPKTDDKYGYIFKAEGSDANNYGTITMLVEIDVDYNVGKISILNNSESYATTVQNDYVDPYNKGDIKLEDVKCGATFGATLIKDMANKAKACSEIIKEIKEA